MHHCQACHPTSLHYQIQFHGEKNISKLPQLHRHLRLHGWLLNARDSIIVVAEEVVAGLYDYIKDHMEIDQIYFKVNGEQWQPIQNVLELIEYQWIDKVIIEEAVMFHMQPIVDVNEQVYAYEMLARFTDVAGTAISPFHVFQAAKKRNRTYALDRVCRMSAVRNAASLSTKVFINFIPTSIYSPEHCLKTTVQLANQLGIEPSRFVFEVVETEQVEDLNHLKNILTYYRERGFHYALDDVGAGFSTPDVLKQLAPHYMKLDMTYVQGVAKDPNKQQTAHQMRQAAVQVGAIPLAEGIEDREDFLWLKKHGYELFQGYLFGKPAPLLAGA